ncbi:MAG: phosphoenolpyruvate synthase [Planctomycetota bacterium]
MATQATGPARGQRYARPLATIGRDDAGGAGGKGANLGELLAAGFPVPDGFVVTADAFRAFLDANGLRDDFVAAVTGAKVDDPRALQDLCDGLRARVLAGRIPEAVAADVDEALTALGDGPVAVRSSATCEDSSEASFAGMNESFLGVRGAGELRGALLRCWASLYSPRVVAYRRDLGVDEARLAIAVVVQAMVDSAWAGVLLTEHPDGGPDRMAVEGAPGLGESVVSGSVTPDHWVVTKHPLAIVERLPGHHRTRLELSTHGVARRDDADAETLDDARLLELAAVALRIEAHYGRAQDIEWAFDREGSLHILQTRPITAGRSRLRRGAPAAAPEAAGTGEVLVRGTGSGFGLAEGRPVVVLDYDPDAAFTEGDVLVTRRTTPDWFPLIRKAAGLVTDEGGATSHAAIVARELGIPGVVGTGDGTGRLAGLDRVVVDGAEGLVRTGPLGPPRTPASRLPVAGARVVTGTEVLCNLSVPDRAAEVAAGPVDGVGLVRAETMLLGALGNVHPALLLERGHGDRFVDAMAASLARLARPFGARRVVYRTHDFRTNEFRELEGGERFEPVEENPMIGMRGCARYLEDPALFRLELEALRRVRGPEGCGNVALMLPFVRTAREVRGCRALIAEAAVEGLELFAMAEVPSIHDNLEVLVEQGFAGVSVGSNDLTQLLLGIDRDNEALTRLADARDPAVLAYLGRLIAKARGLGLHTSICGQAPSLYEGYAERLVAMGIDAISVNPDVVVEVRYKVAVAERRLLLAATRRAPAP